GGKVYHHALLLSGAGTSAWAGFEDAAQILSLAGQIDVVLVGTGAEISYIPAEFRRPLEEAGIGIEVMSSPSACRTYNILLSEGRRIAAALLPVGSADQAADQN
ncbi:MAG: Mth938-like domain-containing protein, partial [Paracoccaceae bacterium]